MNNNYLYKYCKGFECMLVISIILERKSLAAKSGLY